jgi:hypothetical protein
MKGKVRRMDIAGAACAPPDPLPPLPPLLDGEPAAAQDGSGFEGDRGAGARLLALLALEAETPALPRGQARVLQVGGVSAARRRTAFVQAMRTRAHKATRSPCWSTPGRLLRRRLGATSPGGGTCSSRATWSPGSRPRPPSATTASSSSRGATLRWSPSPTAPRPSACAGSAPGSTRRRAPVRYVHDRAAVRARTPGRAAPHCGFARLSKQESWMIPGWQLPLEPDVRAAVLALPRDTPIFGCRSCLGSS